LTTAAALSAIAAPVALVGVFGGSSEALEAQQISRSAEVRSQDIGDAVRFDGSVTTVAELARLQQLVTLPPVSSVTTPAPVPPGQAPSTTTSPPTTAAPAPAPAPRPAPRAGDPNDPATWDRLAQCEAGGNWSANTGNGYYGGLQFSARTWRSVGGTGLPHEHSRETQIEMGKRLQARAGWSQWPSCTRRLGYR
jgi:hypothetical protein